MEYQVQPELMAADSVRMELDGGGGDDTAMPLLDNFDSLDSKVCPCIWLICVLVHKKASLICVLYKLWHVVTNLYCCFCRKRVAKWKTEESEFGTNMPSVLV